MQCKPRCVRKGCEWKGEGVIGGVVVVGKVQSACLPQACKYTACRVKVSCEAVQVRASGSVQSQGWFIW